MAEKGDIPAVPPKAGPFPTVPGQGPAKAYTLELGPKYVDGVCHPKARTWSKCSSTCWPLRVIAGQGASGTLKMWPVSGVSLSLGVAVSVLRKRSESQVAPTLLYELG